MSRIANILLRARDSLADHNQQRWTDPQLLRLLDEAQKDIARHSKLLKGTAELPLSVGIADYSLPEDLWLITRASVDGTEINLFTFDQMDEQVKKDIMSDSMRTQFERTRGYNGSDYGSTISWQADEGPEVIALVYDNRDVQSIRVYPIPSEDIAEDLYTFSNAGYLESNLYLTDSPFGVLAVVEETDSMVNAFGVAVDAESVTYDDTGVIDVGDVYFASPFGILSEIEDTVKSVGYHGDGLLGFASTIDGYTEDSPFGVVSAMYAPDIEIDSYNSDLGTLVNVNESSSNLQIWYIRIPVEITSLEDELELPPMFDTAIRLHLVGNAFLDDNDAASQQKSQNALSLFDRELDLAKNTEQKSGVRNPVALTTSYRGPFE